MPPPANPERDKYHRFPGEIISHGGWLSYRFSLSYRAESMRELGRSNGYEASRLKGGEDQGEAPACLMSMSASTT